MIIRVAITVVSGLMVVLSGFMSIAAAQDGADLFRPCAACHSLDPGRHRTGPSLAGVIGRTAGTITAYGKYSDRMVAAGEAGLVWSEETVADFLNNPKKYLWSYLNERGLDAPSGPRMRFKVKDADKAAAIARYLAGQ